MNAPIYVEMTGAELRKLVMKPKRNKYNAERCVDQNGVIYDSRAEMAYAVTLTVRLEDGEIRWWSWAPRFMLQAEPLITYRPDFLVDGGHGKPFAAIDVKGHATPVFRLKARLWKARFPTHPLYVVKHGELYSEWSPE